MNNKDIFPVFLNTGESISMDLPDCQEVSKTLTTGVTEVNIKSGKMAISIISSKIMNSGICMIFITSLGWWVGGFRAVPRKIVPNDLENVNMEIPPTSANEAMLKIISKLNCTLVDFIPSTNPK